jgi:hypothetical protein
MFDLESRKKNTKYVVNIVKNKLYKINPNHSENGFFVLIIHWIVVGFFLLGLFIFDFTWLFFISIIIWLIICGLHLYYNGCICTKIERELWQTKDWYGPWTAPFTLLKKIDVPLTQELAHRIFIAWAVVINIWIIIRIIFHTI